jgi:phage tail sheath gpL-like
VTDVGRTDAEINDLFGVSHLSMVARAFRGVNTYTNMDAIPLADNAAATHATSKIEVSGTATRDGVAYVTVVSKEKHSYEIDIASGDTAEEFLPLLRAAIAADRYLPFTQFDDEETYIQFTAVNGGTHANTWLLAVECAVPGLSFTLTGWSGGGTNPSLTGLFDGVDNIRYQTIVWPEVYSQSTLKAFINPRKNVDNDVKDGRAFFYRSAALATVKAEAATINSSEIVMMWNEPTSVTSGSKKWIGPHLPEAPDVLAAKFAAARARRFEDDVSISDIVATNESSDQFGGIDLASLPYFNTPLLGVGMPARGTGASYEEQLEAEEGGVTVLGVNRSLNGFFCLVFPSVTAYLFILGDILPPNPHEKKKK